MDREESEIELIELVSYCANKCRNATNQICSKFAANVKRIICKKVSSGPTCFHVFQLLAVIHYSGKCV